MIIWKFSHQSDLTKSLFYSNMTILSQTERDIHIYGLWVYNIYSFIYCFNSIEKYFRRRKYGKQE